MTERPPECDFLHPIVHMLDDFLQLQRLLEMFNPLPILCSSQVGQFTVRRIKLQYPLLPEEPLQAVRERPKDIGVEIPNFPLRKGPVEGLGNRLKCLLPDIPGQTRFITKSVCTQFPPSVTEDELQQFIAGKTIPDALTGRGRNSEPTQARSGFNGNEFRILDHIHSKLRKAGKNYVTQCPSCADAGHDRGGDNLSIRIDDPRFYKCWAGCTKEMIRGALGCPIRYLQSA